jgi:hypothetical protein
MLSYVWADFQQRRTTTTYVRTTTRALLRVLHELLRTVRMLSVVDRSCTAQDAPRQARRRTHRGLRGAGCC